MSLSLISYRVRGQMETIQFLRIYWIKWLYKISDSGLRVYSSSDNVANENPLLVVVRQEKGILSWKIPFFIKREDSKKYDQYTTVNRTLCPIENYPPIGNYNTKKDVHIIGIVALLSHFQNSHFTWSEEWNLQLRAWTP